MMRKGFCQFQKNFNLIEFEQFLSEQKNIKKFIFIIFKNCLNFFHIYSENFFSELRILYFLIDT